MEEKALKQELHDTLDQLIAEGESLLASGKNEAAREKYFEALDLVPQPKGAYYEATWLYAAIGDTYLSEENFEDALDYFMEAYYAVNGSMNPYVLYITGKCNYETGSIEEAKKYFRLAKEYDDKNIFELDGNKYLEVLNES